MNPDDLKQAWQAQTSQTRLAIDPELLVNEVRRNRESLTASVFWRDVREVGVALIMVPVWIYLGVKTSSPWTWYLMVPALLWVAGFMLVDRMRHKRRPPGLGEPLRKHVEVSLAQVEHQIWLLRNVLWWYLLPPGLAILATFGQSAWDSRAVGWRMASGLALMAAVQVAVFGGVYWLNQRAVRAGLDPRRKELQTLLASLDGNDMAREAEPAAASDAGAAKSATVTWKGVFGIVLLCAITAFLSAWAYEAARPAPPVSNPAFAPADGDPAVTNILVPIRQKYGVPAIAAAVVTSKGLLADGVVGARKRGEETAASLNDKWHLGSDAKAMTATLVAKLVERGQLKWNSTLAEIFPDLSTRFHQEARAITVLQLLSHRSGLKPNPDLAVYRGADGSKERLRILNDELSKAPGHKPGTHYEYSNLGYSVVGAIIERITGKTWEQAMQDEIFGPLGMTSVGFGGTGTPGKLDQPWGHLADGKPVAANGPDMDNPPVLSPAGRIHCTIQDWAKFIADQLRGARGEPALLQPASYKKLHTPPFGGEYALGWLVVEREWGGGTVLSHAGDNTMNFANVWVAPRRDFAILVCVNQSGDTAFQASDDAISALIDLPALRTAPAESSERKPK